jgi:sodium-dependent phosphate cotransporter
MNQRFQIPPKYEKIIRILILVIAIYVFLVSIKLMGSSFKLMGEGFAESLVKTTSNPFVGLFIGLLVTSIVQSSSSTTSMVVALVGGGMLPLRLAVPMVMGANIGTTVTNILVSMGHLTRRREFKRAFAGATVHDIFNVIVVLILFPLEYFTHFLEKTASYMATVFVGSAGMEFETPLNYIVKPVTSKVLHLLPPPYMIVISIAVLLLGISSKQL